MPDEKKIKKCCGTCKHWDRNHKERTNTLGSWADCLYPIPPLPASTGCFDKLNMQFKQGTHCSVWEEYKKPTLEGARL